MKKVPVFDIKAYRGVKKWFHAFLTSALDGCEWSPSHSGTFSSAESASSRRLIRGQPGKLAGEKNLLFLLEMKPRLLGCRPRSLNSIPTELPRFLTSCPAYTGIFSNFFTEILCGYTCWKKKKQLLRLHLCAQWIGPRRGNSGLRVPPAPGLEVQSFITWPMNVIIKLPQVILFIYCPIHLLLSHDICQNITSSMNTVLEIVESLASLKLVYRSTFQCTEGKWSVVNDFGRYVTFCKDKRGLQPLYVVSHRTRLT
jgi:hypothetical protein